MKSVTHDFDVITDAPAPQRRPPEPADKAPQPDAEKEQGSAAPPERSERDKIRAAE